ncbi:MAG: hypothetical protein HY514_05295 [Candidatus Aenigmarchaeota archaeon]|nr:hypothetical protein [Candidatus Aenigmarchaeota archaeon]
MTMKGTLDIEFIISVLVFMTTITIVSISIINNFPKLHQEIFSQDLKAKSFQISELLMFDRGEPTNWDTLPVTSVKRLGLSNGTKYDISPEKVSALQGYCTAGNYAGVKDLLGLDFRNDVSIEVRDIDLGTVVLDCRPAAVSEIRAQATITRFVLMANESMKMTVAVL